MERKQDLMTSSEIAVDGVEVKSTLVGPQIEAAIESFGLRNREAARRIVYFFDVIEDARSEGPRRPLRLLAAGVILRLRRRPNGRGESTLKLRPADPHRLTGRWAVGSEHTGDYRIEYDWAANRVLATSLDADLGEDLIDEVVESQQPVKTAFTDEQQSLLDECGSPPPHPFHDLKVAGPITALRWADIETGPFTGQLSLRAEHWSYTGGPPFLELSLKTPDVDSAGELREELAAELRRRGLEIDPLAETKTETVLRALLETPSAATLG
jgi:hypothetical protein